MTRHNAFPDTIERARHYGAIARDSLGLFADCEEKRALDDLINFCINRAHRPLNFVLLALPYSNKNAHTLPAILEVSAIMISARLKMLHAIRPSKKSNGR